MISASSKPVRVQKGMISDSYRTHRFDLYVAVIIMYAKGSKHSRPMQNLSTDHIQHLS